MEERGHSFVSHRPCNVVLILTQQDDGGEESNGNLCKTARLLFVPFRAYLQYKNQKCDLKRRKNMPLLLFEFLIN